MSKIYSIFTGELMHDEPKKVTGTDILAALSGPVKHVAPKKEHYNEFFQLLDSDSPLTTTELDKIEQCIDDSAYMINQCGPNEMDIVEYRNSLIDRCATRLQRSLDAMKKE